MVSSFESDLFRTPFTARRFEVIQINPPLLDRAAGLTGTARLRAYDAVQLASAEAARAAAPDCDTFACFDSGLRDAAATCFDSGLRSAAATSDFALYPRG